MHELPTLVEGARTSASQSGFPYSCDDDVGRLLAALAASVPRRGRILELGSGVGVGTAWIVHGLGDRSDVEVVTIEVDAQIAAVFGRQPWPAHVRLVIGDAVEMLSSLGQFDLVFADAQGGKWSRLDLTVEAIREGGYLLVDDMTPTDSWEGEQVRKQSQVRDALCGSPALVTCEMDWATGVILCVRRR
jgi:predicted O-methyltransferase YrrM